MKKSISDLYEQILLGEAEKNSLQNPSNNEVGDLPSETLFGKQPNTVKDQGPEKAKLQKGPSYSKVDMGSSVSSKEKNASFPKSSPAKNPSIKQNLEMEDEEVTPDTEEMDHETPKKMDYEQRNKKPKPHEESFTMSAFEELFKKTLNEQTDEDPTDLELEGEGDEEEPSDEMNEEGEGEEEGAEGEEEIQEEEEDLISDLRALQTKLNSILDKLESLESEEEEEEEEEYSEDEFEDEFGPEEEEEEEEEAPMKESKESPLKAVNKSKIKTLQQKKNKVGKISPKGGKAKGDVTKASPSPKALGDKKKVLQNHNNKVKSSIDKGEFFK